MCQKYYCQTDTNLQKFDKLIFQFTLGQILFPVFFEARTVHTRCNRIRPTNFYTVLGE
jgi:hypothetical protein